MCSFLVWKNACFNYREFNLEGDLVGVPHTWYLSAQSFIRLLKLVWSEYDIVAMNERKKKCVGLQRTWVSKRTVKVFNRRFICANAGPACKTWPRCNSVGAANSVTVRQTAAIIQLVLSRNKKIGTRWGCHDGKLATHFVIGKRHRHVAYA